MHKLIILVVGVLDEKRNMKNPKNSEKRKEKDWKKEIEEIFGSVRPKEKVLKV